MIAVNKREEYEDLPLTHDSIKSSMSVGAAPRLVGRSSSYELSPEKSITDSIRCDASIKRTVDVRKEESG